MTKQQPAPTPPAFFGAGREFIFQVGQQKEVVVAGNRADAMAGAAVFAVLCVLAVALKSRTMARRTSTN